MNRTVRIVAALAALAVALMVPLLAAAPAHASPAAVPGRPVTAALCTTAEWQSPANFGRCTATLKNNISIRVDCLSAPTPDNPDSGLAGWFIAEPDENLQPGHKGLYTRYGLGGYRLGMYDVGVAPACAITHPIESGETATASMEFTAAAAIVGAANGVRDDAYHPADLWGWSDGFITDTTQAIYHHVFTVFGIVTLAVAGIGLVWQAHRGDLPLAVRVVGWALLVMVATTAVAQWPTKAVHGAETVAGTGLAAMHNVAGPPDESKPADQCPLPDPAGCVDHRSASTRASDTITAAVLYRAWLRAELGSADSPTAKKYGAALYDAGTLTWSDADTLMQHPDQRAVVVAQKADQWNTIAAQIKTEDPQAYEHMQGLDGTDRIGAGLIALSSAAVYAGFDLTASTVIVAGFVVFLFAVMLAPLFATWGLWLPASGGFRRLVNAVVASTFNIILFGGMSGLYLRLVAVITSSSAIPGAIQFVIIGAAGVGCAVLLHPLRKLTAGVGRVAPVDKDVAVDVSRLKDVLRKVVTVTATATGGPAAGAATGYATAPHGRDDAHRPPTPAAITTRPESASRVGSPS